MKKIKKYFALIFAFLILPSIAFAAGNCDKITTSPAAKSLCNTIIEIGWIISVAGGAIAVVFIIVAGIKYVTAGENEDQAKGAKKMIINALIGVAIILAAYFLVQLVADFIYQRFGNY